MAEYTVDTLPEVHRRARDTLSKRWASHVDCSSPAWPVAVGSKDAVAVIGRASVVIVIPGLTGSESNVALTGVRPVGDQSRDVDIVDSVGYPTRIRFLQVQDAARFVALANERSVSKIEAAERRLQALDQIMIVTTDSIPGADIVAVHGDVFGVVVRARNIFSNVAASFRTVAGGEVAGYTKLMADTRNDARERLAIAAVDRGANAVAAMRYSTSSRTRPQGLDRAANSPATGGNGV